MPFPIVFLAPDQPSSRAVTTPRSPPLHQPWSSASSAPAQKKALPRRGAARLLSILPLQGSQSGRLANEIRGSRAYYLAECQVADVMIVVSLRLLHVKLRTIGTAAALLCR